MNEGMNECVSMDYIKGRKEFFFKYRVLIAREKIPWFPVSCTCVCLSACARNDGVIETRIVATRETASTN